MNLALWILQGILAASCLIGGMLKVVKLRLELIEKMGEKMAWAKRFSDGA